MCLLNRRAHDRCIYQAKGLGAEGGISYTHLAEPDVYDRPGHSKLGYDGRIPETQPPSYWN